MVSLAAPRSICLLILPLLLPLVNSFSSLFLKKFKTIFRHYIYDFGTCGKPATNAQHVVFT